MEDVLIPLIVVPVLFIGLPWLIFHYVTQWKKNGGLTVEDERLLDEMHDMARRLDDRLGTLEVGVAGQVDLVGGRGTQAGGGTLRRRECGSAPGALTGCAVAAALAGDPSGPLAARGAEA